MVLLVLEVTTKTKAVTAVNQFSQVIQLSQELVAVAVQVQTQLQVKEALEVVKHLLEEKVTQLKHHPLEVLDMVTQVELVQTQTLEAAEEQVEQVPIMEAVVEQAL
jgi:predicted membrane chloride channel (bestrophin family)